MAKSINISRGLDLERMRKCIYVIVCLVVVEIQDFFLYIYI